MKSKQLLAAFVMMFIGSIFIAMQAGDIEKRMLNRLNRVDNGVSEDSLTAINCKANYSSDCEVLVKALSGAFLHYFTQDDLQRTEEYMRDELQEVEKILKQTKDARAKEVIASKLAQEKTLCPPPQHKQNYLETLSEEERVKLNDSIKNLLHEIPIKYIENESIRIDEILSGK